MGFKLFTEELRDEIMRRQSLVARVYAPRLWFAGWLLSLGFLGTQIAVAITGLCLLLFSQPLGYLVLAIAAPFYVLDLVIGLQRRRTATLILPDEDLSTTFFIEIFAKDWVVLVTLAALICSAMSRRMIWRGRVYILLSPQETLLEQGTT